MKKFEFKYEKNTPVHLSAWHILFHDQKIIHPFIPSFIKTGHLTHRIAMKGPCRTAVDIDLSRDPVETDSPAKSLNEPLQCRFCRDINQLSDCIAIRSA